MKRTTARSSGRAPPAAMWRVGSLGVAIGLLSVGAGVVGWNEMPAPFVWRDVATVSGLAALPFAHWLTRRWIASWEAAGLLGTGAAIGGLSLLGMTGFAWGSTSLPGVGVPFVWRSVLGLGFALTAVCMFRAVESRRGSLSQSGERPRGWYAAWYLLAWLLLPSVYLEARVRSDLARLEELASQSRWGETYKLARSLQRVAPASTVQGTPLARIVENLGGIVADLEARVQRPLAREEGPEAYLRRAQELGMLGRTSDALRALDDNSEVFQSAAGQALRGTILETRGEWELGRVAYQSARDAWERQLESPERTRGLIQAVTGVAFCERKQGRLAAAEEAYAALLRLAPTADTHFLLARFYEDTQQTRPAREHARHAMSLAPERYGRAGHALLEKLTTSHFGCWTAYRERAAP